MDKYTSLLDNLLFRNIPFAAWSMPREKTIETLICTREELMSVTDIKKMDVAPGFLFAPYKASSDTPIFILRPGIRIKNHREACSFDTGSLPSYEADDDNDRSRYIMTRPDYISAVEQTVSEIRKTRLSKVIISRLIQAERRDESVAHLYMQLRAMTPNAFVYMVNIPHAGLWMGATPEALVRTRGRTMETVSLAGTQPRKTAGEYYWSTKDIEEQAFVSRYMLDMFYRFGIRAYTTKGPETMESGKVAHLKTSFFFPAGKVENIMNEFIAELHPTPAVCGLPRSLAQRAIAATEKHDRRYYTGYLGLWEPNNSVSLFVNLRCMEITRHRYILYSGGGITSRSDPGKEWDETNNKAQTLLSAIGAVQST